jgi:hypothetical protein
MRGLRRKRLPVAGIARFVAANGAVAPQNPRKGMGRLRSGGYAGGGSR